ncbi:uncharacterized protein LOC122076112 [Macadamia integrifolia]|uniref:uncharacterized protein LOC122076112 n=1 Tax=Macadamia integrifolia TaxID=60698 RepID=UPI001C4E4AF8|nr:uncharacterized protein LOC122076112 [Macadamia integrifolia]
MMFISNTHFDLVSRGSANEFLFRKMVPYVSVLWFYVSSFMFYLISLVNRYVFRFHGEGFHQDDPCGRFHGEDDFQKDESNCSTPQPETIKFEDSDSDEHGEKDIPKFCFKFQYQTSQETKVGDEESDFSVPTEEKAPTVSNSSKYQFSSGKDFCGFMEEPEVLSFTVNELYASSNYGSFSNKEIIEGGFLSEKDLRQLNSKEESIQEETEKNYSADSHCKAGETEPETLSQEQLSGKEDLVGSDINFQTQEDAHTEIEFLIEKDLFSLDSYPESVGSSDEFSLENLSLDPKDGFLSDKDFEKPSQTEILLDFDEEIESFEETLLKNSNMVSTETMDISDRSSSSVNPDIDESEVFHSENGQNSRMVDTIEFGTESDREEDDEEEATDEDFSGGEENETMDISGKIEEPNMQNMEEDSSMAEPEDENELETQWEHQDLIEQLKIELKKVRAAGLPTILEESESPRVMEDLKPWKIDEKFMHEDRINELHKFYKSYRERMRKFDILNYQKMYAISFLQLKDPLQSISNRKSSIPALTSVLSNNFRLGKSQTAKVDPTVQFVGEVQSDLEMVYVGHMCLSWEILHWQFGKSQELQESDTYGFHRYNQVASEFQQFQVLIERFLENEAFQGPRVQNYVRKRCELRNLLQVPAIKEDSSKDKKKSKLGDNDAIKIGKLTDIIEESMRIFWEFVRADDKHEATVILKGFWRTQVELQDPSDLKLLTKIRSNVQKKEKKLKEILRSGNCIVKRFQKRPEDRSELILFFSQVDMKLITRVLNMSKIKSEQLIWCDKKLEKIDFVDRKIRREPSFLLFPCT